MSERAFSQLYSTIFPCMRGYSLSRSYCTMFPCMRGWCYVSLFFHAFISSFCHILFFFFFFDIYKALHPLLRERERERGILLSLLIGSLSNDKVRGMVSSFKPLLIFFYFMLCIIAFQIVYDCCRSNSFVPKSVIAMPFFLFLAFSI